MDAGLDLPPAYRLVSLESVGSTNEEAKRLARGRAEDGTLVWARSQTAGRGRVGRAWISPPGNLYLSLVLRPEGPAARAAELGMVASVALGEALGALLPPLIELRYKWPNDVLLNRRKVAGILLEAEPGPAGGIEWIVLGLGVNVATYPEGLEPPATSLKAECGEDFAVEQILEAFARHFLAGVNRWLDEGLEPARRIWKSRALGLGEKITVRLAQRVLEGVFADLDEGGALVLERPSGARELVTAGDVFFGGP